MSVDRKKAIVAIAAVVLSAGMLFGFASGAARRAAAASAQMAAMVAGLAGPSVAPPAPRERQGAPTVRRRHASAWWMEHLDPAATPEGEWVCAMRVPRTVFVAVLQAIEKNPMFEVPINVGPRQIPVDKQLACFLLRIGASMPVHTVRKNLAISEGSVSTCVRRVARAIVEELGSYVGMPRNGSQRKKDVLKMFKAKLFPGCVGIIDCTHVEVTVPTEAKVAGRTGVYKGRSGRATLTFQVIWTPERSPRILSVSGGEPGSAYDTKVLERSSVYKNLGQYLEGKEYLAGDCGYSLRPWMMRGWGPSELRDASWLTQQRFKFNKFYSGVRISAERGFGILKARFRAWGGHLILRDEDDYRVCFLASAILHNICAEYKAVSVQCSACLSVTCPPLTLVSLARAHAGAERERNRALCGEGEGAVQQEGRRRGQGPRRSWLCSGGGGPRGGARKAAGAV